MTGTAGKESRCYKAFIIDLDGVLTDTAELHYQGWRRMAAEEGLPFDREANEKLRGLSRRASLEAILAGREVGEEKIQELMARKNSYYRELIKKMSPAHLLPGALNLLDELACKGFALALASASRNARDVLRNLQLEGYFDFIADGHSVSRSKPAPDLFLFAASSLGVEPGACVVIEDAAAGVSAARAAGMAVVGIGPRERVGDADLIYPSVAEIAVDKMVEALP